jgi:RimJ/RimL family protein N-acetyltransferase
MLRPFTGRDGKLLQGLFMDPEVTGYLPWGHPYSDTETRGRLQQLLTHWRRYRFGVYAIRLKSGRRLIGYAGLEVVENTMFVELLYAISRRYWGKGYAFEAAAACVKNGFDSIGLPLIVGVTAPGNEGSKRVLEKLGMKPAPEMDFYGRRLLYYSLSRERYAAKGTGRSSLSSEVL